MKNKKTLNGRSTKIYGGSLLAKLNKQMIKCRKEAQTFEYWKNWFFKTLLRENFKMCNLEQK